MRMQSSWGRLGSNNRDQHGAAHAATIANEIEYAGVDIPVSTPGVAGSRIIRFLPQLLSAEEGGVADAQGANNLADSQPMNFICRGDAVIAFQDVIGPYDGSTWTIIKKPEAEWLQGVPLLRHCIAMQI